MKKRTNNFQKVNFLSILVIFFVSIFLLPFQAHAAYRDIVQADSPLYYWPMDEAAGATSLAAAVGGNTNKFNWCNSWSKRKTGRNSSFF